MAQVIDFGLSPNVVYITSDPTLNTLVIKLSNLTGAPMPLVGGQPVVETLIGPDGPSIFYFSFPGLITAEELQQVAIDPSGWTATWLVDGRFSYWGVCPPADC